VDGVQATQTGVAKAAYADLGLPQIWGCRATCVLAAGQLTPDSVQLIENDYN